MFAQIRGITKYKDFSI